MQQQGRSSAGGAGSNTVVGSPGNRPRQASHKEASPSELHQQLLPQPSEEEIVFQNSLRADFYDEHKGAPRHVFGDTDAIAEFVAQKQEELSQRRDRGHQQQRQEPPAADPDAREGWTGPDQQGATSTRQSPIRRHVPTGAVNSSTGTGSRSESKKERSPPYRLEPHGPRSAGDESPSQLSAKLLLGQQFSSQNKDQHGAVPVVTARQPSPPTASSSSGMSSFHTTLYGQATGAMGGGTSPLKARRQSPSKVSSNLTSTVTSGNRHKYGSPPKTGVAVSLGAKAPPRANSLSGIQEQGEGPLLKADQCAGCQRLSQDVAVLKQTVKDLQRQMGQLVFYIRDQTAAAPLSASTSASFKTGSGEKEKEEPNLREAYAVLSQHGVMAAHSTSARLSSSLPLHGLNDGEEERYQKVESTTSSRGAAHRDITERKGVSTANDEEGEEEFPVEAVKDSALREYLIELSKARRLKQESEGMIHPTGPSSDISVVPAPRVGGTKALITALDAHLTQRDEVLRQDIQSFEKRLLQAMVQLANRTATLEGEALRTNDELKQMKKESSELFHAMVRQTELKPTVLQIFESTRRRSDEDIQNLYDLLQLQPSTVQSAVASRSTQQCVDLVLSSPPFKGLLDAAVQANTSVAELQQEVKHKEEQAERFGRGLRHVGGAAGADESTTLRPYQRLLGMDLSDQNDLRGLLVVDVFTGGPAQTVGIQRGDRISRVNGTPVLTVQDFIDVMGTVAPNTTVKIHRTPHGRHAVPDIVEVMASTGHILTSSSSGVPVPAASSLGPRSLSPVRIGTRSAAYFGPEWARDLMS